MRDVRGESGTSNSWVSLVYHDVLPSTDASGGGPERFAVPTTMFDLMLDTIAEEGHLGCSLSDAIATPGEKRVAITFDDATASQFQYAMPSLRARGMTATVFVATDWVGTPGYMTWDELRQISDWGMSVQSHTKSHPFLSELGAEQLRYELETSKATIDRELAQDTHEIAFPGGDAPAAHLRHLLKECGYRVAIGTRWGRNADGAASTRFVRRCTVRGSLTKEEARRFVRADSWLALGMHQREVLLRTIRSTLGASRYHRWRRRLLDSISGATPTPGTPGVN